MWKKIKAKLKVFWFFVIKNERCCRCRNFTPMHGTCGICDRGLMFDHPRKCAWEVPCEHFAEKQ